VAGGRTAAIAAGSFVAALRVGDAVVLSVSRHSVDYQINRPGPWTGCRKLAAPVGHRARPGVRPFYCYAILFDQGQGTIAVKPR